MKEAYNQELQVLTEMMQPQLDRVIEKLKDEIDKEAASKAQSGLVSQEAARQTIVENLKKDLFNKEFIGEILEGFHLIDSHKGEFLDDEELKHFEKDLAVTKNTIHSLYKEGKKLENISTPQEVFQISDFLMNSFEKIAYSLFEKGLYENAKAIYALLTVLNPLFVDYFLSLSAVNYRLGDLDGAISAASFASLVCAGDLLALIRLASLLIEKGERENALTVIQTVEKLAAEEGDQFAHRKLFEEVKQLL